MHRPRRHHGYVLAMTLLLLAMAATALGAVASESHRRAIAAVRAQEDLQRRWGAITCEQALLPHAARVIDGVSKRQRATSSSARNRATVSLHLGGQAFVLVFGDEQVKVNVNTLAARRVADAPIDGVVRRLLPKDAQDAIRLSPTRLTEATEDGKPVERLEFVAYGQVFGDVPAARLMGRGSIPGLASDLTCWGDGRLNDQKASPAAIAGLCAAVLGPEELVRFREAQEKLPQRRWEEIFSQLKVPPERGKAMKELTTATSTCHSLWVAADVEGRPLYRMAVAVAGGEGEVGVFEW